MSTGTESVAKSVPPYLPYKTFANTLAGWTAAGVPGRIDRTLFRSFSGAMQNWVISTLRYFNLIDVDGHPTARLHGIVSAEGEERQRLVAQVVKEGYGFVFAGKLDLATATAGQIQDRFKETGLQGDTVRKAVALFLALAAESGMKLSPYMKLPRQRRQNGSKPPAKKPAMASRPLSAVAVTAPARTPTSASPVQTLIDMLDIQEMDDAEQAAVWTLIRYLKKRGS